MEVVSGWPDIIILETRCQSRACKRLGVVKAAEEQTRIRPRRRTEYVEKRIVAQQSAVSHTSRLLDQQEIKASRLKQTREMLIGKRYHAQQLHKQKPAISAAKTMRLTEQIAGWDKRLVRLEQQLLQCHAVLTQHQAERVLQEQTLLQLQQWLLKLKADNATYPDPPPYCEVRMDAGFTSGENITWLIEMGYCPNTKATNDRTTQVLRGRTHADTTWVPVGDNAEMTAWDDYHLHNCSYPVTVALERFKVGTAYRYATLVRFRDDGQMPTLPYWFTRYNQRQTIEAGNKEMKGTFFVQHLMTRSLFGIPLQVLFTGVAANSVRWCQPWLHQCTSDTPGTSKFNRTLESPKSMVHVAANSAALVLRTSAGTSLQFAPNSSLGGVTLYLHGVPAFQPSLGFFQPFNFASP